MPWSAMCWQAAHAAHAFGVSSSKNSCLRSCGGCACRNSSRSARGAGAAGGSDRRGCGPDHASRPPPARQGRRSLHLGRHGFSRDAATGWTNVRLLADAARPRHHRDRPRRPATCARSTTPRSTRRAAAAERVVGGHPIDYFGAIIRPPVDELDLLASLRAALMPVVKSITNDMRVPADRRVGARRLSRRGRLPLAEGPTANS